MEQRDAWELTVNDQKIVIPGDYVLVPRKRFEEISKAFAYIEGAISKYGPDPKNRDQHGLIFARVEASDCTQIVAEMADKEGTTAIWTMEDRLRLPEAPSN
jgi:hypothetical protein